MAAPGGGGRSLATYAPPKPKPRPPRSWVTIPGEDFRVDLGNESMYTSEADWIFGIRGLTRFREAPVDMAGIAKLNEELKIRVEGLFQIDEADLVGVGGASTLGGPVLLVDSVMFRPPPIASSRPSGNGAIVARGEVIGGGGPGVTAAGAAVKLCVSRTEAVAKGLHGSSMQIAHPLVRMGTSDPNRLHRNMNRWRRRAKILQKMAHAATIFAREVRRLVEKDSHAADEARTIGHGGEYGRGSQVVSKVALEATGHASESPFADATRGSFWRAFRIKSSHMDHGLLTKMRNIQVMG